jgi:hypothetical protein
MDKSSRQSSRAIDLKQRRRPGRKQTAKGIHCQDEISGEAKVKCCYHYDIIDKYLYLNSYLRAPSNK